MRSDIPGDRRHRHEVVRKEVLVRDRQAELLFHESDERDQAGGIHDPTVEQVVVEAITELDRRGILHSIASRGEEDLALETLKECRVRDLFLVPKINWLPKSQNITAIAHELGISLDAMAFIDDDAFEREQVAHMLPAVMTIPASQAPELPSNPAFTPATASAEAAHRRQMYQAEMNRRSTEPQFASREDFLASCAMTLTLREMAREDIPRVLELMTRTHQLNTTGLVLTSADLEAIVTSDHGARSVVVARLTDRFGGYGIIGVAVASRQDARWVLEYLALSCRVMGRGIERAILGTLIGQVMRTGQIAVEAEFRDTGRNRMMRALYQMMGFLPSDPDARGIVTFRLNRPPVLGVPSWVHVL